MGAKLRSWWQYIGKHKVAAIITVFVLVVVIVFIFASYWFAGYWFGWTGFNGDTIKWQPTNTNGTPLPISLEEQQPAKALWDWLQLLFIPAILTLGAVWITARQNHDREIAEVQRETDYLLQVDNQREAALQAYLDQMSELILHKDLRSIKADDEVRNIARVRTLVVLPSLDGQRKDDVFQFLYESKLISKDQPIIPLNGVDLSGINQVGANLSGINLSRTNLREASFNGAELIGTDLSGADLSGADLIEVNLSDSILSRASLVEANLLRANLTGANFDEANLSDANLTGASVTDEQLTKAKSLKGAIIPDGSIYP